VVLMQSPRVRRVLIVCRTPPYGNSRARDAIDAAMAFAAFEQSLTLLFLGEGVLALTANQDPAREFSRNLANLLGTLPDYGIEALYADSTALQSCGLASVHLVAGVTPVSSTEIAALVAAHEHILTI
jgi:tRNA 2-thiouridine synthesizing protein C